MKRTLLSLAVIIVFIFTAHSQNDIHSIRAALPVIDISQVPDSAFEKGIISIKFKKNTNQALRTMPATNAAGVPVFNIPAIDKLNQAYHVTAASGSFGTVMRETSNAGLHTAAGLQLWYQLRVAANTDIRRMIRAYAQLNDIIEIAEPVYKKELIGSPASFKNIDYIPADPRFSDQWHYSNTGQFGGTPGDDIHLPAAWDIEKGNPNVIVAVIDQGIQFNHPDLAQNMWSGIGYNFVTNSPAITPGDHGTHTSGTIAAVNNNGVGLSGIAGGDGTPASGVRLMSCEVFGPSSSADNFGAPFIWAADHGAAIAQNSWGYTVPNVYEQSVLDAIDYFIANGGGTVMHGGLVIFSSGNNNSESMFFPGAYSRVISVAATNYKDVRSYYSNYGTWVSISAPGGEQTSGGDPRGVLSTVTGNTYQYMQGTSMACPHVSGVAALILSHAINRVSPDDIKSILLNTTDNHYPSNSPFYAGKLGTGRLNALKALQATDLIVSTPLIEPVTNYTLSVHCPNIDISWTKNTAGNDVMVAYSADGNFGIPSGVYAAGDLITGGGTVLYNGSASGFSHPVLKDSTKVYYKIWSTNGANYSLGQLQSIATPYTVLNFNGSAGVGNIALNWTKQCPNSDVIVAFNTSQTFGNPSGVLNVGNTLGGGGTIIYKGPAASFVHNGPVNGKDFYKIWPYTGTSYSYGKSITVCYGTVPLPLSQGFEATGFPPVGWSVSNPDNDVSWNRVTAAAKTGVASMFIPFYSYAAIGQQDYILSPPIDITDADSVLFDFARAYRQFDNSGDFDDTLEVVVSADCGASFTSAWKKAGAALATNAAMITSSYLPIAGDWKKDTLNLRPFTGNANTIVVGLKSTNRFGQNLFIDDINLHTVVLVHRNTNLKQIIDPSGRVCDRNFIPLVQVENQGLDTIKNLEIVFGVNPAAMDSLIWTGTLSPHATATVLLKKLPITSGNAFDFTVYTKQPNGLDDQIKNNDTATAHFTVSDPVSGPVKESFEQISFPPVNWSVAASNSQYTWERNTMASTNGSASAWMRNRVYNSNAASDELYSPVILLNHVDSVFLLFDVAHVTAQYAGSTGVLPDTLEVLITPDCGKTFSSVYKKWGLALQTVSDPNAGASYAVTDTIGFVPGGKNQWRTDSVNLTPRTGTSGSFQVVFRNINHYGNNTYLDNINIRPLSLPVKLKQQGYLVTPNPTEGRVYVQHYLPPTNLKAMQVISSNGQVVWRQQYNGNALSNIPVDLTHFAGGIYTFRLVYSDKVIVQRVVKMK